MKHMLALAALALVNITVPANAPPPTATDQAELTALMEHSCLQSAQPSCLILIESYPVQCFSNDQCSAMDEEFSCHYVTPADAFACERETFLSALQRHSS